MAFEWVATYLNKDEFSLGFILLNRGNSALEDFLRDHKVPVKRLFLPRGWRLYLLFFKLWWILLWSRPDIIHTHLRYASLLGVTAGFFAGIKKRIHTRHHSTSNHLYHPHAVKTDKWITALSTRVVAISKVVEKVLIEKENADSKKIHYIPHGFNLQYFGNQKVEKVQELKTKYLPQRAFPVIGIISRYLELKGIEYGIEAFKRLLQNYPQAHLIIANATGPYKKVIAQKLSSLKPAQYTEIIFEPNINSLYDTFDVYLHLPIYVDVEAFGQTYIESLASGIPSVFTRSGIGCEILKDQENALIVPYKDAEATYLAIRRILENNNLREKLIANGKLSIQDFNLKSFISRLENLYRD